MRKLAIVIAVFAIVFAVGYAADCKILDLSCADEGDECVGDFLINGTEACYNNSKCCSYYL